MKRPLFLDLTYGVASDEIDLSKPKRQRRDELRQAVPGDGVTDWTPVLKLVVHTTMIPEVMDSPHIAWKYLGTFQTVITHRHSSFFELGAVNTAVVKDIVKSNKELHYRYLRKLPDCPVLRNIPVVKGPNAGENYVMACMVKTFFRPQELEELAAIITHHFQMALDAEEEHRVAAEALMYGEIVNLAEK